MTSSRELKELKDDFHDSTFRKGRCILAARDCLRCEGKGWTVDKAFSCFVCDGHGRHICSGVMDAHHVLSKMSVRNAVKREDRDEAMWDARNGVPICRIGHGFVTTGTITIPRDWLPPSVWAFAGAYDITWLLEKAYSTGDWSSQDGQV
jgi:hypothetical protein